MISFLVAESRYVKRVTKLSQQLITLKISMMDSEWLTQFEEHRKRLNDITKLLFEHSRKDTENLTEVIDDCRSVVKESVIVKLEVTKIAIVTENTLNEIISCNDLRRVLVNEIYERECAKEVETGNYNYEEEYDAFVANLKENDNEEDKDIVVSQQALPVVDPWSKLPIEFPVKSKVCGHVYNKASVEMALKSKPHFKCPYIGCKLRVMEKDLE